MLPEQLQMKRGRMRSQLRCRARTQVLQIGLDNEEPVQDFDLSLAQLCLELCVDFIEFCDGLDFAQVAGAAEDAFASFRWAMDTENIVIMADVLHHDSAVFRLLMKVALDAVGMELTQPQHDRLFLEFAAGESRISAGIARKWALEHPVKAVDKWLRSIFGTSAF